MDSDWVPRAPARTDEEEAVSTPGAKPVERGNDKATFLTKGRLSVTGRQAFVTGPNTNFEEIVQQSARMLNSLATSTINGSCYLSKDDRDDLRQVALLRLHEQFPQFKGVRKAENISYTEEWKRREGRWVKEKIADTSVRFSTYAYAVCWRAMKEYERAMMRQRRIPTGASDARPSWTTTDGRFEQIVFALRDVRDVDLLLYEAMGYDDDELAPGLNLRQRKSRARTRIKRKLIERELFEASDFIP